jgi:hypothetical protein
LPRMWVMSVEVTKWPVRVAENFGAEAAGLEELEFVVGVEDAEARMPRIAEHAATAAVGEGELTEFGVVGVRAFFGHGRILWIRFFGRARETAGRG